MREGNSTTPHVLTKEVNLIIELRHFESALKYITPLSPFQPVSAVSEQYERKHVGCCFSAFRLRCSRLCVVADVSYNYYLIDFLFFLTSKSLSI
jgi:hypothetical protein